MWGSWLDQIQKKLDDVSGLVGYEDEEEYEEEECEEEKDEAEQHESQQRDVKNEWKGTDDRNDTALRQQKKEEEEGEDEKEQEYHPPQRRGKQVSTGGRTAPISESNMTDNNQKVKEESPVDHERCTYVQETNTTEKIIAKSTEKHVPLVLTTVERDAENIPPSGVPASPSLAAAEVAPADIAISLLAAAAITTATAAVMDNGNKHESQDETSSQLPDTHHEVVESVGNEEHLLRFQRQLAEEMEVSRILREENQRLSGSLASLEREVNSLRQTRKTTIDPQKVLALEREGMELSTQLGRERERNKQLQEKKAQFEEHIASLEEKLAKSAQQEEEWKARVEACRLESQVTQRRLSDLCLQHEQQRSYVEGLEQQLARAKQRHAELIEGHQEELSRHVTEMSFHKKNIFGEVETLRQEKESLISSIQQTQMEYERRLQEVERKLNQANRRADAAETRLSEHERSSLGPLREMRGVLEDVERQKRSLLQELEYATQECAALKRGRITDRESHMQQLEDVQRELQLMQDEKLATERELIQWKTRQSQLQKSLDGALERVAQVEEANDRLTAALEEATRRMDSSTKRKVNDSSGKSNSNNNVDDYNSSSNIKANNDSNNNNTPPVSFSQYVNEPGGTPLRFTDMNNNNNNSFLPLPLFQQDAHGVTGNVGRGGPGRMERELVRQAVEIERLRRVEMNALEMQQQMSTLAAQHDLLMQMYGKLQEEQQRQQQQQQQSQLGQ